MPLSLLVIDDFLTNFEEVRARALALEYKTVEYQGHKYAGIGLGLNLDITGDLSRIMGLPVKEHLNFCRLGRENEDVTSHIHADLNCGEWATVLYLNSEEQCQGGTAFWRNKRLNSDTLPPPDLQVEGGLAYSPGVANLLNAEGNDESKWELKSVIGMKPNRLIMYPTHYFHSRYPQKAFGSNSQTGRIVHVTFFDLVR